MIAQRLARTRLPDLPAATRVPAEHVGLPGGELEIFEAVGCPRCRQTGYRGRVGLYEVMNVTDEIRTLIVSRAPAHEIARSPSSRG